MTLSAPPAITTAIHNNNNNSNNNSNSLASCSANITNNQAE